jgi:hypothetical protein
VGHLVSPWCARTMCPAAVQFEEKMKKDLHHWSQRALMMYGADHLRRFHNLFVGL